MTERRRGEYLEDKRLKNGVDMPRYNASGMANHVGRPPFWTPERIAYYQETLEKHANNEESYDMLSWRAENNLTYDKVGLMCEKSKEFREAYEIAKAKIGSRRQKEALVGNWHAGMVQRDDWAYSPEVLAYQREMRDKEASGIIPAQLAAQAKIDEQAKQIEELQKKLAELTK